MARKPRIVMDNGYYHIIQRGNDRRKVFRAGADYKYFYLLLKKYLAKYPSRLYHYCLMSNHLHLLIEVTAANDLSKLMQGVNLSYTLYYKKRYKFTGSLWQGRYKSIPIEKDEYLIECGRYIERNPVRAGIVGDPKDYFFSSYNFYAHGLGSDIITQDVLYERLGHDEDTRQAKYREYALQERPYDTILDRTFKLEECPLRT
jgi:putative transposase